MRFGCMQEATAIPMDRDQMRQLAEWMGELEGEELEGKPCQYWPLFWQDFPPPLKERTPHQHCICSGERSDYYF